MPEYELVKREAHFTVRVTGYRLAPRVDVNDTVDIYSSGHRSPRGAARRLASIIAGKSAMARRVARSLPAGFSGRYFIATAGESLALIPFRAKHCGGLTR